MGPDKSRREACSRIVLHTSDTNGEGQQNGVHGELHDDGLGSQELGAHVASSKGLPRTVTEH